MKSRKSSLHAKVNPTRPKITHTCSHTVISQPNQVTFNNSIQTNSSAYQTYNNLFGQKVPFHTGDADFLFRNSLRKYSNFRQQTNANSSWLKPKVTIKTTNQRPELRIDILKAAGDSFRDSSSDSDSSSGTYTSEKFTTVREASLSDISENMEGEDAAPETPVETAPEEAGEGEEAPVQDPETIKNELNKSLEQLKTAVDELDAEALNEISPAVADKIGEMQAGDGESKAIVPLDNNVIAELEEAERQARSTANIINELKERVATLLAVSPFNFQNETSEPSLQEKQEK